MTQEISSSINKRSENALKLLLQPGIRVLIEFYKKKDDSHPRRLISGFLISADEMIENHTFISIAEELGLGPDVCSSFIVDGQPKEAVNKFGQRVLEMGSGRIQFRSNCNIGSNEQYEKSVIIKS